MRKRVCLYVYYVFKYKYCVEVWYTDTSYMTQSRMLKPSIIFILKSCKDLDGAW